jgi:hypothetical protein
MLCDGIQLGVQDVLYKKPSTFAKTILKGIFNDENSSDSDEDFSDGFQVVMSEKNETIERTDDLQPLTNLHFVVLKMHFVVLNYILSN